MNETSDETGQQGHAWEMTLSMDASSPQDVAARLRDLAWDIDRNPTAGRRVFAGVDSSGVLDLAFSGGSR